MSKMTRNERVVWNKLNDGDPAYRTMEQVIAEFQKYVVSYTHENLAFGCYTDEAVINDMIYGIGTAFSDSNKFRTGDLRFKRQLLKQLQTEIDIHDSNLLTGEK